MDFAELSALASGHAEARAIQTALKLGIFDVLERSPLDDAALAAAISTNRRATALIANAMVALELLDKRENRYSLTEASRRYLLRSSAEYLGGLILFDETIFQTWTNLEQTIRTGLPARPTDMFQSRPEETERFILAMDSLTRARGDPAYVANRLDLSKVSRIADIGGGPGTYTVALLRRWPHLRGAIYDLPATLEVARKILAEREPAALARIDLVRVDYLYDEIPGPCGALFMSNIIHNEDETDNAQLFRKCFRALEPGGLMIIKDHIMSADLTQPRAGAIFALYLLLTTRGRDYSFDEVSRWLSDAGFVDIKHEALPSPPFTSSMVTARKPK
jgi:3-hydroxy-5-methyl-1-naphthoate 3-O-methyltransferase